MKLEPRFLTPYLQYSLKVIMEGKKTNVAWMSTKNIAVIRPDGVGEYKRINWKHAHHNIKPILRPLSDLTKDEFEELYDSMSYNTKMLVLRDDNLHYNWAESTPYFDFTKLLENHFDVFGLIEKGLAIDVNTLKD